MEQGAGEPQVVRTAVVVDDDPHIRRLLSLLLELDLNIEVAAAVATVAEAEEAVRSHQPDVVVVDQLLGDRMSGLALAPRLKRLAPDARIVLFSAGAMPAVRVRPPASRGNAPRIAGAISSRTVWAGPGVDAVVNKMGIELLPALVASLLGLAVLEQLDAT
jgi:CheY-like chemotaxis protein